MKGLFKKINLPDNLEVLFMLALGIMFQVVDGSPFSLKERWKVVWETELPPQNFSPLVQKVIKTVLSIIVAVRCVTTYAYVVSAMLVIFCLSRNSAPKLMLFWLLVAGVKSLCMTFLEALTGVYVCSAFGKIRKACIEFFISKALEIILSAYLWGSVQTLYQDMERKAESRRQAQAKEQLHMQKMDFCRQRARSLVDESTLYKTACLNNFEFKDVPQIIMQMLRADTEMSQDSLLGPGMMLASVSNLGSFDHLKTSQSLGELGFMDLGNTQVVGLEEDDNLSYQEKALRFLKLTNSDVKRIAVNKRSVENDIYTIDRDMWKRVEASGTHLNKPKHPRTQVFIHDMSNKELCDDKSNTRKKLLEYKFGFSFSTLYQERQPSYDEEQDEELILSHDDEDEDDDEPTLFMSNIKEGATIRPRMGIVCKKMKGNSYKELYRQDYMSVIGPEVFDKACKLPKVTSLTKLSVISQPKTSVSLPAIPDLNASRMLGNELKGKMSQISSEDSELPNMENIRVTEFPFGFKGEVKFSPEIDTTEPENQLHPICNPKQEPDDREMSDTWSDNSELSKPTDETSVHSLSSVDNSEGPKQRVCFRKRRIIIKRIGKRNKTNWFWNTSSGGKPNSNQPEPVFVKPKKDTLECNTKYTESWEIHQDPEKHWENPEKLESTMDSISETNPQVYFLTDLLHKPLLDVLLTYYDLKKRVHVEKNTSSLYQKQTLEFFNIPLKDHHMRRYLDFTQNQSKAWKSMVLKTADARHRENSVVTLRSVLNIMRRESVLRRLFRYEYAQMMSKNRGYYEAKDEAVGNDSDNSETSDNRKPSETDLSSKTDMVMSETDTGEETDRKQTTEMSPKELTSEVRNTTEKGEPIKATREQEVQVLRNDPEGESTCSQESDEPISLYYSKAANLASPLFDMKRFIYPDHIHYSYKHVRKKGFDVDINGGLPLLVRESLTMGGPVEMGSSRNTESEITRRPMDLSFASTNAFAEWQNNEQNDLDVIIPGKHAQKSSSSCCRKERNSSVGDSNKSKKLKKMKRLRKNSDRSNKSFKIDFNKPKPKQDGNFNNIKYLYSTKDYALIEKLIKMHVQFNSKEFESRNRDRKPVQISSTQLHSNKGRRNSTYNPAIFLQENKTRTEKKKVETQQERTNNMFARLEREALLQSKNVQKSFGPNRNS